MESNAVIPQKSIDYLVDNPRPGVVKSFDKHYGEGRAKEVLAEARKASSQDDRPLPVRVIEDVAGGVLELPRQVYEGGTQGGVISPAKLLQRNFGDVQFDAPVTLFNDNDEFDPQWTGFNIQSMTAEEFRQRDDAGEQTGLDASTTSTPETFTGSAVREISKFGAAFVGLGKFFRAGKGLAGTVTQSAAADFLGFEGNEGRLVDTLNEMGVEVPLAIQWLQTEEDDSDITGRLKNMIEGAGIGFAFDGVMRVLRGFKRVRKGDEEVGREMIEEGLQEIEGAARNIESSKIKEEAADEAASAVAGVKERQEETAEQASFAFKLSPAQAAEIREATILRSNQSLARRPDINVNLDRVNAEQDVVDLIASQRDVLRTEFDRIRGGEVQTWDAVSTRADALAREMARMAGADPSEFAKRISEGFSSPTDMAAELHARWNVLMTIEEDIKRLAREVEDGVGGPQRELELMQRMELGTNMLAEVQGLTTNVARALNALKMIRKGDPSIRKMMLRNTQETFGADAKAAARAVNEATKAGKSPGRAIRIAQEAAEKSRRFMDDVNTFRINAMLSGPGTQEVNFVSNAMNLLLIPAEQALGGKPVHAARTFAGMLMTAKESLQTSLRALWNEEAYLDPFSTKLEGEAQGSLAQSKHPIAKVIRMPSRLMISADELFKQAAYRGRIFADALTEADQLKLTGENRKKFLKDYVEGSFDENGMAVRGEALHQAQRTTFTEGMEEQIMRDIMQFANRVPLVRLVLPFIRTPVNILSQSFQHLPAIGLVSRRLRRDLEAGGYRRAQAIGRQVMGTSIMLLGMSLAAGGMLTGSGPKDPRARKVWLQNNRPYSLRWKDKEGNIHHWEYQRLEPLSSVLAIFADLNELAEQEETRLDLESSELVGATLLAITENTTNKTFTQGISDLITVMSDDDDNKRMRALNKVAGSFVPNVIPQLQNDPMFREIRDLTDELGNRLGLDGIDPKRNMLGEIVYRRGNKWDPLGLTEGDVRKPDLVMAELERLGDLYGSNFDVPRSYRINGNDIREIPYEGNENQSLYDRQLELAGTIKLGGLTLRDRLSRLFRSKKYARMQDGTGADNKGPKHAAISRLIRQYRTAAERQLLRDSKQYRELKLGLRRARRDTRRFKTLEEAINE